MKLYRYLFMAGILFFLPVVPAFSQCCSPGNPVAGASSVGVVSKHNLRSITFFRHSFSDTYYEGNKPSDLTGVKADYNYLGQIISYGLTHKLTLETELGYFINKTKKDPYIGTHNTYGFNTVTLSAKYCLMKTRYDMEVTAAAGVKIPLSQKPQEDIWGVVLEDMQTSTQAFGYVAQLFVAKSFPEIQFRVILLNRYEVNERNPRDYRFGDALYSSLFLSKGFLRHFTGLVQLRNESRRIDMDGNIKFTSTGGNVMYLAPSVSYSLPRNWNVSVLADFPVMRDYKGVQLGPKYAWGVSVVKGMQL